MSLRMKNMLLRYQDREKCCWEDVAIYSSFLDNQFQERKFASDTLVGNDKRSKKTVWDIHRESMRRNSCKQQHQPTTAMTMTKKQNRVKRNTVDPIRLFRDPKMSKRYYLMSDNFRSVPCVRVSLVLSLGCFWNLPIAFNPRLYVGLQRATN